MMRISFIISSLLLFTACGSLEYRALRGKRTVAGLKRALAGEKDITARWLLAGDFYQRLKQSGAPVVEDGRIHFFYWDEQGKRTPSIVGPFNYWRAGELPMKRLNGTPLLTVSLPFVPFRDIRYLTAFGPRWTPDPLCRNREVDKTGRIVSLFSPVRREWPSWAWNRNRGTGRLRVGVLKSRFFRNSRKFLWYIPPGLKKGDRWRMLVVQSPFREEQLSLYRNIFDNLYRSYGDRKTVLIILPVLNPQRELPLRSIDYLDMVKHDLSGFLEKQGWAPAGAEDRTVVMSGRGAGFLLLSLIKGMRYFPRLVILEPDDAHYRRVIRYFSRFRRAGRLKDSRLLWLNSRGKEDPEFSYAVLGLKRQGLSGINYLGYKKSGLTGRKGEAALLRTCIGAALGWK